MRTVSDWQTQTHLEVKPSQVGQHITEVTEVKIVLVILVRYR